MEATLSRWGRSQQLLEGSGDTQLGEVRTEICSPMASASPLRNRRRRAAATQLAEAETDAEDPDHADPPERSVAAVSGSTRPLAEAVVRDRILQWLAADAELEPRDVLVTPHRSSCTLLASVFNDRGATG